MRVGATSLQFTREALAIGRASAKYDTIGQSILPVHFEWD